MSSRNLVCYSDVGILQADAQRVGRWRAALTPPTHLGRLCDGLVGRGHLPHIFLLRQRHRRDVGDLAHGTLHRLDRRRGCDRTIDLDVEVRCEGVGVRYRWREIE